MAPTKTSFNTSQRRDGLTRHLEGWQGLVVAVFIAGSVAALVVPRPVEPVDIPAPRIDPKALAHVNAVDDMDANAVEQGLVARSGDSAGTPSARGLDADVRDLGSALRAHGRADADGDEAKLVLERQRAAEAGARAVAVAPEEVRRLRAYHLRCFVRAVRAWEGGADDAGDLRDLGGGFLRMLRRHGWVEWDGSGRRVLIPDAVLRALFKKRWNETAGLRSPVLALSLDEHRAMLRFLIQDPPAAPGRALGESDHLLGTSKSLRPAFARSAYEDQVTLKKIDELSALDPSYPADLARGVVFYRLRRYSLAVEAFRRHLDVHADGPNTLRVQNYLRAALGRSLDETF